MNKRLSPLLSGQSNSLVAVAGDFSHSYYNPLSVFYPHNVVLFELPFNTRYPYRQQADGIVGEKPLLCLVVNKQSPLCITVRVGNPFLYAGELVFRSLEYGTYGIAFFVEQRLQNIFPPAVCNYNRYPFVRHLTGNIAFCHHAASAERRFLCLDI